MVHITGSKNCNLRKIDHWEINGSSLAKDTPEATASFWKLVRQLYDGGRCHIDISVERESEDDDCDNGGNIIKFYRYSREFKVDYRYMVDDDFEVPEWVSLVKYMNIVSLTIGSYYIFDDIVLLLQDIVNTGVLDNQPVVRLYNEGCSVPLIRACGRWACELGGGLEVINQLSQIIPTKYPCIEELNITEYIDPTENLRCQINLRVFTNLQYLTLCLSISTDVTGPEILVSLIYEGGMDCYYFRHTHVVHVLNNVDETLEKPNIVRIFCTRKLAKLTFKTILGREKNVPIIEE